MALQVRLGEMHQKSERLYYKTNLSIWLRDRSLQSLHWGDLTFKMFPMLPCKLSFQVSSWPSRVMLPIISMKARGVLQQPIISLRLIATELSPISSEMRTINHPWDPLLHRLIRGLNRLLFLQKALPPKRDLETISQTRFIEKRSRAASYKSHQPVKYSRVRNSQITLNSQI